MKDKIKEKIKAYYVANDIDKIIDYITNLQEKVNQYENPDDMTLFYMWLDTKAKDKMKHMENEITMLKQQNSVITGMGLDYKSRNEKTTAYYYKTLNEYNNQNKKMPDEAVEMFNLLENNK